MSIFKKKKTDSGTWVRNNDFYQENIFNNYKPNFIWVKNLPEFSKYIIKNGLPDLVSFDHDLSSKTVRCDHNGADCARWLVKYCKENALQMPKCFAHTANNKQRPILNDILGLNESIILESCDYVFNDEGQKCNSTGTVWKGVEYAKNKKNVPKGIGAYPFIIHNGRLFASTTPNGHGDFLKTEVLPKTEYNGVDQYHKVFTKIADEYMKATQQTFENLYKIKLNEFEVRQVIADIVPINEHVMNKTQIDNQEKIRADILYRFKEAPDLKDRESTGARFIQAVADTVTHIEPFRKTANWQENRFKKAIEGNTLIDVAMNRLTA